MAKFDRAVKSLPAADRQRLQRAMHQWSIGSHHGRRICPNIRNDRFIPLSSIRNLLSVIKDYGAAGYDTLEAKYLQECYKHSLKGGAVRLNPAPSQIGRAVDKRVLINHLITEYLILFNSRSAVVDFVDRITRPGTAITHNEATALMSKYASWVTWNINNSSDDPFDFFRHGSADEVRAHLGLIVARKHASPHLLLLCYNRSIDIKLHRPTIADAGLHPYFRPPEPGESRHGWTVPWPPEEARHVGPDFVPEPRPEALHEPAPFGLIRTPVRCLR